MDAENQERARAARRFLAQMAEGAAEMPLPTVRETCPAKLEKAAERALCYIARHHDEGELIDAEGNVSVEGKRRLGSGNRIGRRAGAGRLPGAWPLPDRRLPPRDGGVVLPPGRRRRDAVPWGGPGDVPLPAAYAVRFGAR